MNKIQRIVFAMACLLTATGVWADGYTIRLNEPSNGTMTSNVATANPGDIVTLTVNPTGNYYLSELYYEKIVSDISTAESRIHRSPSFSEKTNIPINTTTQSYRNNHYGGTYTISMPSYDIEVTAIFTSCTSIIGATLHWDSTPSSTSITYDHALHTANVYLGGSDLIVNANYTISPNNLTNAGSITPTITGVGTYCGTTNNQTITITQRTLTITPNSGQSKVYGEEDPTFTYTSVGLVAGDAITGTLSRQTPENNNAGTYKITQGTLSAGDNYAITFDGTVDFTINPKNLTSIELIITLDHDYFNYSGGVQKAEISTIKYGNTTLTEGAGNDYTYAYGTGVYTFTDYTTPDIYPITITFTGNYTGTKTVNYQIRPEITRTGSNWTTYYYNQYEMRVPSGLEAYTVSSITSTQVGTTSQNYLLRGVPMLIYRTGDTQSFYPELVSPGSATINGTPDPAFIGTDSHLDMATATSSDPSNDYWILKSNQFVRTKSGSLDSNKCYLKLPKTQFSSPSISLSRGLDLDDETTSIDGISKMEEVRCNVYYDLNGRRVLYPTKGIYIVNGKKIVIK